MNEKKRIQGWKDGVDQFEKRLRDLEVLLSDPGRFNTFWEISGLIRVNENARKCAILESGEDYEGKYLKEEYKQ